MLNQAFHLLSDPRPLCALYAREARDIFPGRPWHEIEPLIRRAWEREPKGIDWEQAAPLVRALWSDS